MSKEVHYINYWRKIKTHSGVFLKGKVDGGSTEVVTDRVLWMDYDSEGRAETEERVYILGPRA